jgi:hypothetical protein
MWHSPVVLQKNFSNVNEPGDTFCSCIMCTAKWKNYTFQILQIQKFASNLGTICNQLNLGWFQIAQLWNFNRNFPILLTLLLLTTANICSACDLHYKCFTIVIYHHNDGAIRIYDCNYKGQYYKAMILANSALDRSINYDHKLHYNLKHTLW